MAIIGLADFKGEYNIAVSQLGKNVDKVNSIIDRREEEIMQDLLGLSLYTEVKDSIIAGGVNPDTPEITKIFDKFQEQIGCHVINSSGIKVMLASMIYFYIAREGATSNTPLGDNKNNSEVSSGNDWIKAILNYNYGIKTYKAIQYYIGNNRESYPSYLGVCRESTGII